MFLPGLLAKAHRGILYVDDINLLDTELCQILLGIVTDGWVNVEVRQMYLYWVDVMAPCGVVHCFLGRNNYGMIFIFYLLFRDLDEDNAHFEP